MAPGLAIPSNRAAILTPSPIRSPSLSSTTSPRWMPMRNSMRRSGGRPALRSTIPFCTSMAQRTASTTLRNSTMAPSPVRLTTRPLWTAIIGSIRSLRSARSRASMRSSSEPASLLYPTTSDYQNRCELPGFGHVCLPSADRLAQPSVQNWIEFIEVLAVAYARRRCEFMAQRGSRFALPATPFHVCMVAFVRRADRLHVCVRLEVGQCGG